MAPPFELLVERVLSGDEGAWQAFWSAVEPKLVAIVRQPRFLGRFSRDLDHRKNIVVEVIAALRGDDFARLRSYAEARRENARLPFLAWLTVVAKRLAIDYLRRQDEYEDRRHEPDATAKGRWRIHEPLPADSELGGAPLAMTDRQTAREMLEYAADALPPEQRAVLDAWIQGVDFAEIARRQELDGARAAERLVRAALERLRYHFRTTGTR